MLENNCEYGDRRFFKTFKISLAINAPLSEQIAYIMEVSRPRTIFLLTETSISIKLLKRTANLKHNLKLIDISHCFILCIEESQGSSIMAGSSSSTEESIGIVCDGNCFRWN